MRYKIFIIVVIMLGFFIIMSSYLKKDLPYHFDFVRMSDGVAIINTASWNSRPLEVRVLQNGNLVAGGSIDPENDSCVLAKIEPIGVAVIEISRDDLIGKIRYSKQKFEYNFNGKSQDYFVLVGASIGRDWNLSKLPERKNIEELAFGSRALYQFDKSEGITPLTKLKFKPKAVVIKECPIYFPRDLNASAEMLKGWVELLRENGIGIILATTTPVAKKEPVKGQQTAIDEWNQFLRDFGQDEKLPVLDLAKALQAGEVDTHLKPGYYQKDGYHLQPVAYQEVLDPLLVSFIRDL